MSVIIQKIYYTPKLIFNYIHGLIQEYIIESNKSFIGLNDLELTLYEFGLRPSVSVVRFSFSVVTLLLTIVALLSDQNHENEYIELQNIIILTTAMLLFCSNSDDLFSFYLAFKSVTMPIYYLIHTYRSDIDKFKACD